MEKPNLMLRGHRIAVHKASSSSEMFDKPGRINTDNCHSIYIRNVGTATMLINGEPFPQWHIKSFTPPALNVIDTSTYDLKWQGAGTQEVWVTRSFIDLCDEGA